jgi:hypothetical protein
MRADAFLVREVLRVRLEDFILREEVRPVAAVCGVEKVYEAPMDFFGTKFRLKAKVDRLDRLADGSLLVVDYKTGATDVMPRRGAWEDPAGLTRQVLKDRMRSLQLPLYLAMVEQEEQPAACDAALYYLRYARQENGFRRFFGEEMPPQERQRVLDGCKRACAFVLKEILDPGVPFEPDRTDPAHCSYCPFFYLCR